MFLLDPMLVHFELFNCALRYLLSMSNTKSRLNKWANIIFYFDFEALLVSLSSSVICQKIASDIWSGQRFLQRTSDHMSLTSFWNITLELIRCSNRLSSHRNSIAASIRDTCKYSRHEYRVERLFSKIYQASCFKTQGGVYRKNHLGGYINYYTCGL